jgi:oligogalacturonide lyase
MQKITTCCCLLLSAAAWSQPVLETGGQAMPDEWIDKDTRHKVIKLSRVPGSSLSFYFHNNPFVGNKMVYYNSSNQPAGQATDRVKQETFNLNTRNKQLYVVDLATLKSEQVTTQSSPMNGEIVGKRSGDVYYQIKDSVFATNIHTKATRLVFVFPEDFKGNVTALNADETLLGGARSTDAEREIYRQNPNKSSYFTLIYEAKLPRTLFTINTRTGELTRLFTDSAWLNHVQFSSTDPNLLMFCHEGPWHLVDRIWTIDVKTREVKLIHKRTMEREIAGHEFPSRDGKKIWFDLQQPRGQTFFLAAADLKTGNEEKYSLTRDEWSIHYNISPDQRLFAGDGGDSGQVAKAKDGRWIYLFTPDKDKLVSEKLVNMKHHNYRLEPNVHFSPDGKWIIFRANFEGMEHVYAVEVKKAE